MALEFTFDMSEVEGNLKELLTRVRQYSQKGLLSIGNEVMRLSSFEVPHDKGILQNSGSVDSGVNEVIVGYHTVYAARLHEHPEYRFQKGRKGKYLEDPIKNNIDILREFFGNTMREAFV